MEAAAGASAAAESLDVPGACCALIGTVINGHIRSVSQIFRIGKHFTNTSQARFWQREIVPWRPAFVLLLPPQTFNFR
jgi:hypothetical protein